MPVHDYRCSDCGHVWEVLLLSGAGQPAECPSCSSRNVKRALSAAHVIKGTPNNGSTCCGRTERCEKPPCSTGGCHRG